MTANQVLDPTRWTRPLQVLVTLCSVIFTIGTTIQNFAIVDLALMEDTMRLAGQTPAEASDNAPGFLLGFRIVGCVYIVGNALGMLAWRGYPWVFWVALIVNVTQAAGVVAIPTEFWDAAQDRYGLAGLLPSIVTDGGALILSMILIASLAIYRTSWARRRVQPGSQRYGQPPDASVYDLRVPCDALCEGRVDSLAESARETHRVAGQAAAAPAPNRSCVTMSVRFGVFVPQGWKMDLNAIDDPIEQFETMTSVAKEVDEKSNFDSIWVYDHFHTVPEPTMNTTFECWTITATLARDTKRVNVGQMVSCNGYRNPSLFAKIASTVDVASHGRLYAGFGAGWYEHEWRAYGYGFPETPERMGMFREAVQIIHKMWTEDKPSFTGRRYTIDEPINEPKNSGKGKIPLWIGGGGEKVTLKLVAQYGDACNVGGGNPETIRHKLDVLRQHCETVGRDYDEITKSTTFEVYPIAPGTDPVQATAKDREARGGLSYEAFTEKWRVGTPEQLAEQIQAGVDAGANYIINYIPGIAYDTDLMHRYNEEIIPLIKG